MSFSPETVPQMTAENEKTTREKLAVLLPHFISHNSEHALELEKWAHRADHDGDASVGEELRRAAKHLKKSGECLGAAFSLLGGKKPSVHEHDHHHENDPNHSHDHGTHGHDH
jgi:hypothetical protein